MMQINPYLQNGQVYRCPSDALQCNTWYGALADTSVGQGYNFLHLNGTQLREIEKPMQSILRADSVRAKGYRCPGIDEAWDFTDWAGYGADKGRFRPLDRAVAGWLD
jgi:hypothetical protein